jgi:Ca2+-binding RTX toxin-like protein
MRQIRTRLTVSFSLAGALTLLLGAQASAATNVTYNPGPDESSMAIDDATNDADIINVSVAGNTITITDTGTGGITTADPDCAIVNANTVTCPLDPPDPALPAPPSAPVGSMNLTLNNGADSFTNQNLQADVRESDSSATGNKTVSSGPGDDQINAGTGNDLVDTGPGDDGVDGDAGADSITTGPGNDFVRPTLGADTVNTGDGDDFVEEEAFNSGADSLNGGPGAHDAISWDGANSVTMTLNGQADDGHPGEGDNLAGFEELDGSDGSDVIAGDDADNFLNGFDGDDQITAAGGADEVSGGRGNDVADAGEGADTVFAGSQADGADVLAGGGGLGDEVDYCCGFDPVTINQNGQADDGRAGEGDNLSGFEGFDGGSGPDSITGNASANVINGNGGADLLVGLGGGDQFFAGAGDDTVVSSGGSAAAGRPALGRAALAARDHLQCDLGFDTVSADARDVVGVDCERQGAAIVSDSAVVSKKGKAKVRVLCPLAEGAACTGKLVLFSNGKQIAKGSYQITNGKEKNATAKLSKKGRKALAASNGSLLVSAEARTTEPPGLTVSTDQLLLTRAK